MIANRSTSTITTVLGPVLVAGLCAGLTVSLTACLPTQKQPRTTPTGTANGAATTVASAGNPVKPDWRAAGIDWTAAPRSNEGMTFTPPAAQSFTLKNGARVIVIENHRLPLVSIESLHLGAGSREDGKTAGLAALTADLLDEGAGSLTADTLPEALERLGASLEVSTGSDFSSITMSALTFDRAAELLGDVVQRPQFAAADFERVKADRLEALALRKDRPRQIAALVFARVVFGEHPYAKPTEGDPGTVKSLTLDAVKQFWTRAYHPQQAVFIVAGDVSSEQVRSKLETIFAGWSAKPSSSVAARRAPVAGPGRPMIAIVHRPDAPQSVVMIGRRSMAAGDDRYFTSEIINTALGGSFASRLNQKLREELGYTYGITSSFWRGRWGGTWTVASSIRSDVTVAGIEEALRIINDARSTAASDNEWKKTQDLITRGLPQNFETNAGIVAAFHRVVLASGPLDWYQTFSNRIATATPRHAQALAATAWNDLSIVIVGDEAALTPHMSKLTALGLPIVKFNADGAPLSPLPGLTTPK